jgi:hypothetical protein
MRDPLVADLLVGVLLCHRHLRALGRAVVHHDHLERSAVVRETRNRIQTAAECLRPLVGHDNE